MDFIVDLPESQGNTVIWTVIDLFSKQAHFVACSSLLSEPESWLNYSSPIYTAYTAYQGELYLIEGCNSPLNFGGSS